MTLKKNCAAKDFSNLRKIGLTLPEGKTEINTKIFKYNMAKNVF